MEVSPGRVMVFGLSYGRKAVALDKNKDPGNQAFGGKRHRTDGDILGLGDI